jgi:CheY-like chemotaxis protein
MPKTLLLADDSVTIQKVVGIVFAGEDYRITAVDNGEDALLRARETRPDIVLADAVMPRMNGYELCQALKADPRLADVPVLLLTGTFEPFDEARARAARADGHVAKPFDSQALLTRVRELVEGVTAEPLPLSYPRMTPASTPAPAHAQAPAHTPTPVARMQPPGPPRRTVPPPFPPPGHPLRAGAARPGTLPPTSVKGAGVRPPPPPPARPGAGSQPSPSPRPAAARGSAAPQRPFSPAPARAPARPPPPEPFGMAAPVTAEDDWSDVSSGTAVAQAPQQRRDTAPPPPPPAAPEAAPADGGEAALRLAISQASREVVEKIAWEVVPQLAEVIIREHVERLVNERQKR